MLPHSGCVHATVDVMHDTNLCAGRSNIAVVAMVTRLGMGLGRG